MPPTQASSSEASSFIIRRRVRRRNSPTNTIMTMGNRSKFLVAGSMIIGALFWTAGGAVGRGGEVVAAGHLRGRAGSFMTDADAAAVDDKASSSRIHPHTQPFNENSVASKATNLIIVAGHTVLISNNVNDAPHEDSTWFLYDYQRHRGLPNAIVRHIQAGIRLALADPNALLVFSGGQTRAIAGPESEGASYFRVSDTLNLWKGRDVFSNESNDIDDDTTTTDTTTTTTTTTTVRARTTSEDFSTDSFENFMFSICRFREITGRYPDNISVVSFTFKRERFETLHANALRWSIDRFHFVGIDPPASTGFDLAASTEGEKNNSLLPFMTDPYGCHSDILQQKRKDRNPFSRLAPYELTCPEMKTVLHWCGPELILEDELPWGKQ